MCLLLYIVTDAPVKLGTSGKLTVDAVTPEILAELRSGSSKPSFRFVGVERSFGCDFRHAVAAEAFDHGDFYR